MSDERAARVLDPSFLEGIDALSTDELRRRRAEAEAVEEALSYVRRLLQGRLDIVRAELVARHEAGSDAAGDLLGKLSAVLADEHPASRDVLRARATRLRVPPGTEAHEQRLDALVPGAALEEVDELPDEVLEAYVERLAEHERELSATRHELFIRIDALRTELAARYKDGRAAISDLLAGPQ